MLYGLYVFGFYVLKVLPIRACYLLADLFANVYYLFSRRDIYSLRENLKVILPEGTDNKTINKYIRKVFRNFARYLVDFLKLSKITQEYFNKKIEVHGFHNLDKCLSEGKGAIIVAPHMGNWELGAALTAAKGYPLTAIVLKHADERIDDFFTRQRSINNLNVVPLGMQLKQCFTVLKQNGFLAIAGDKDYTSGGDYVDFFGKKAVIPTGAAAFSIKTGSPIIVCTCIRKENDEFRLVYEEPIKPEETGDYKKDLHSLMGKYLSSFEKHIREHPDQWYAFQEIWKQEPTTR
jgi:KDO2-lipid IV(A) lauroyltransferase